MKNIIKHLKIERWLKENATIGGKYTINEDFTVDVNGGIITESKGNLPDYIQFRKVSEFFDCSHNNLTSLKGCPFHVGGDFFCEHNKLTSLEGCPSVVVDGDFFCQSNKLTSLEGCPSSVGGGFYCQNNNLTSLKGCPFSVSRNFYCQSNKLTSLEGCPSSVGGSFYCQNNKTKLTKPDGVTIKKLFVSDNT